MPRAPRLMGPRALVKKIFRCPQFTTAGAVVQTNQLSFDTRLLSFQFPPSLDRPVYNISLRASAPDPHLCGFAAAPHPAAPGPTGPRSEHARRPPRNRNPALPRSSPLPYPFVFFPARPAALSSRVPPPLTRSSRSSPLPSPFVFSPARPAALSPAFLPRSPVLPVHPLSRPRSSFPPLARRPFLPRSSPANPSFPFVALQNAPREASGSWSTRRRRASTTSACTAAPCADPAPRDSPAPVSARTATSPRVKTCSASSSTSATCGTMLVSVTVTK